MTKLKICALTDVLINSQSLEIKDKSKMELHMKSIVNQTKKCLTQIN